MKILVINETRPLEKGYHYLTPFNTVCLIASNKFISNSETTNGIHSMSYTRYFSEDIPTFATTPSPMLVRLKLDIEKISNNYSIKPFQHHIRYRYKSDLPKKVNTESEERILSTSGIDNFNQYILEVQVLNLVIENDIYKTVKINDYKIAKSFPSIPLTPREMFDISLKNKINITGTQGRNLAYKDFLPQSNPRASNKEKEQIEKENNSIINLIESIDNFNKFCNFVKNTCNLNIISYSKPKEERNLIYYSPNYKNYSLELPFKNASIYSITNLSKYNSNFVLAGSSNKAIEIFRQFYKDKSINIKLDNILSRVRVFPNLILDSNDSPEKINSFKTFVQNNHLPFKVISDKYIIEGSSVPIWNPHSIELSIKKWN